MELATLHINDLPEEVLLLVFSMLPVEQLATCVQHVCQRWRSISQDWRLWEHYTFSPNRIMTEEQILDFLKQAPMLRSFTADIYFRLESSIDVLCAYCSNLCNLKIIWESPIESISLFKCIIPKIFKEMRSLESFTLIAEECYLTWDVFECITHSSTLKSLEIMGQCMFGMLDQEIMWKLLADGLPALEKLIIKTPTEDEINLENLKYLVERKREKLTAIRLVIPDFNDDYLTQIMHCKKLETLHIINRIGRNVCLNRLGELPLKELSLEFLSNGIEQLLVSKSWTHLIKLNLSSSVLDNTTVDVIVNQCPVLKRLQLDSTLITAEGLKNIYKIPHLQHISVKYCAFVTNNSVRDMALCPNLLSVDLGSCQNVSDEALGHLLTCTSLREIRMDDCPKLTGGSFHLIPGCLPNLKLFSLDDYEDISSECLQNLRVAMPNLKLEGQPKYTEYDFEEDVMGLDYDLTDSEFDDYDSYDSDVSNPFFYPHGS